MAAATPPLSLGEILDRTVQVYRRNFLLFFGISALPAAVDVVISGAAGIYFSSHAAALQQPAHPGIQAMMTIFLVLALFAFIGVPFLLLVFSIALSALNNAAFERIRGAAVTVRASYGYGFRHFWRHVGILFLQFLFAAIIPAAVYGGIFFIGVMMAALMSRSGGGKIFGVLFALVAVLLVFALIFAAVWIWLRFCLAFAASKAEAIGAWPSLKRSNQLSKGSRGRIFVMYLLVAILTLIAYYAITFPIDIVLKLTLYKSMDAIAILTKPPIALQVWNLFVSFLERAFVMPIYSIALLLFYNDQRTRQEGYDIELLMAQAGWANLPSPPPAPAVAETAFPISPVSSADPAAAWPEPLAQPFAEPIAEAAPEASGPEASGSEASGSEHPSTYPPPEVTEA